MLPSQFVELDPQERAFIIAAIDLKIESDKKQEKEMKSKARKKRK